MNRKPTYEELAQRVADLEKKVKELEAQPREQHIHYHSPVYQQPCAPPSKPEPVRLIIGDPPYNPPATTWINDMNGTVTWPGGYYR